MQVISSHSRIQGLLAAGRSLLLAAAFVAGVAGAAQAGPEIGSPAPDFAFEGSDGQMHLLSEHRGKRGVVVAWFPKAFTPG